MIRPRQGNFVYNDQEKEVMLQEVRILKEYGADGFVSGILDRNKNVDADPCQRLLREYYHCFHMEWVDRVIAENYDRFQISSIILYFSGEAFPLPVTFHRAFDVCEQWQDNLRRVIDMGFHCILSSGQAKNACSGRNTLRMMNDMVGSCGSLKTQKDLSLVSRSLPVCFLFIFGIKKFIGEVLNASYSFKILQRSSALRAPGEIMAGCGINESNLKILCQETGVKIYHASASEILDRESNPIAMGSMDDAPLTVTTVTKVKALKKVLDAYKL
uniref:Copper homeostasis protein cutC homolog n=1 Tax=Romanomermis culicivorax TaxID=13658 RepID=A0A915HJU6_ROMCU